MNYYASCDPPHPGGTPPTIIIAAESAFDAKAFAQSKLSGTNLMVQPTGDDARTDYELRWVGSDYGAARVRRMQVRQRTGWAWSEWTDC